MINIAGAFCKFKLLKLIILKYKGNLPLAVYDGVEDCKWNGGRINNGNKFDKNILDYYNNKNIPVFLTFSNSQINLDDKIGNELLEQISGFNNGVIVANHNLKDYIRKKYPNLKIIFSVTGHPNTIKFDKNYFKMLESEYDLIVPRFEMTFNDEFIENVNHKKYEIMVNDTCKYGCKLYKDHFEAMNKLNREFGNPYKFKSKEELLKIHECWLPDFNPNIGCPKDKEKYGDKLGMDLSINAFKNAKEIGYNNFKIMGRELEDSEFIKEVECYLNRITKTY